MKKVRTRFMALMICLGTLNAFTACDKADVHSSKENIETILGNPSWEEPFASDYTLQQAKDDALVVHEDGSITSGQSTWDEFVSNTERGIPTIVWIAFYYTLDNQNIAPELYEEIKDDYPVLYIQKLTYDGEKYTLYYVEDEGESEYVYNYKHLKRFEYTQPPNSAVFTDAVYYYLVNDLDVTYEQIRKGMVSSFSGNWIDCQRVYSRLNYKHENTTSTID